MRSESGTVPVRWDIIVPHQLVDAAENIVRGSPGVSRFPFGQQHDACEFLVELLLQTGIGLQVCWPAESLMAELPVRQHAVITPEYEPGSSLYHRVEESIIEIVPLLQDIFEQHDSQLRSFPEVVCVYLPAVLAGQDEESSSTWIDNEQEDRRRVVWSQPDIVCMPQNTENGKRCKVWKYKVKSLICYVQKGPVPTSTIDSNGHFIAYFKEGRNWYEADDLHRVRTLKDPPDLYPYLCFLERLDNVGHSPPSLEPFKTLRTLSQKQLDRGLYRLEKHGMGSTGKSGIGTVGDRGMDGSRGHVGSRGHDGSRGRTGIGGAIGQAGADGDTGSAGLQGDRGATGRGDVGDVGCDGAVGRQGGRGNTGCDGDTGDASKAQVSGTGQSGRSGKGSLKAGSCNGRHNGSSTRGSSGVASKKHGESVECQLRASRIFTNANDNSDGSRRDTAASKIDNPVMDYVRSERELDDAYRCRMLAGNVPCRVIHICRPIRDSS